MKKVQVTIAGKQYSLLSDQSEEHVVKAAGIVDKLFQEIVHKVNHTDETKVITLVALKLASSVLTLEESLGNNDQRLNQCIRAIDTMLTQYRQSIRP